GPRPAGSCIDEDGPRSAAIARPIVRQGRLRIIDTQAPTARRSAALGVPFERDERGDGSVNPAATGARGRRRRPAPFPRRPPLPRGRRRGRVAPMAPESIVGCVEQIRGGGVVLIVDAAAEPPEAVLGCA